MRKLNVEKFRKMLLDERDRLSRELDDLQSTISYGDTPEDTSELADYDQHPADAATDTFEKEKDVSIGLSLQANIGRIDEALDKIERGTYGECDRCGREISEQRLDAIPEAIYCAECQDIVEGT